MEATLNQSFYFLKLYKSLYKILFIQICLQYLLYFILDFIILMEHWHLDFLFEILVLYLFDHTLLMIYLIIFL